MATVTVANANIPVVDSNGNYISQETINSFGNSLAALAQDGRYYLSSALYAYDSSSNYQGQYQVLTVYLIAANDAAALTLYNNFKASLASGTIVNLWYVNQTLA